MQLEACSDGSFFTSWSWIGAWIKSHAADSDVRPLRLLTVERAGETVALAIVGEGKPRFLSRRAPVLLHESGGFADSGRFIEYNDILVHRAAPASLRAQVFTFLSRGAAGVRVAGATPFLTQTLAQSGLNVHTERRRSCPWIRLDALTPDLEAYMATLGRNTRQQIRRSLRLMEASGPVAVTRAGTVAQAKEWFAELRPLHEATWQERNSTAGAFAWAGFAPFVHALIEGGTTDGSVDILRVTAGARLIGVLVNFVYRGHVYAYQNGFAYSDDNRLKPGLVSHALAVAHYRRRGCHAYHFMAGEGRYKTSLGPETEELTWLMVRDNSPASRIEIAICALKERSALVLRTLRCALAKERP